MGKATQTIREAVGLFDDAEALEAAVDELESSGFDHAAINLLAGKRTVDKKLGHRFAKTADLEDDPDVPRTAYVARESVGDAEGALIGGLTYVGAVAANGAIIASGGAIAAAIIAAVMLGGAGALVGSVLADIVGHHHAAVLKEHLDHGGLLLWVRTDGEEKERRAMDILTRHSGRDVHVHDLPHPGSQPSDTAHRASA